MHDPTTRTFLFLQGPHGPFFGQLGRMLARTGARCWRIGFNRGDGVFWPDRASYIPYRGTPGDWPDVLARTLEAKGITDIVLYGDTRPVHAEAVRLAAARGIEVHVFEEGYLRPYWVTYERGGSNGHSPLMSTSVAQIRSALTERQTEMPVAPAHWGEMRQHVWYGALYHAAVLLGNRSYSGFRPHRALSVRQEFRLYLARLLLAPLHRAGRVAATRRVKRGGFPYHLALLQLEHDSNFLHHSPFETGADFLRMVIEGFAAGAPAHHHLVFKAHPLEDGRVDQRRAIRRLAREHGVAERVHYIRGGKLATLLDHARSAVTVNSTAGQQVLWRGLPLRAFGAAVYGKPEFVSTQPLAEFFRHPLHPDAQAYRDYRRYLLETSQIAGGFYSASGRRQLLRQVTDRLLAPHDPYGTLRLGAAPRLRLHVVNE
ncbi:capsule biosynthesis protein [Palleronia marisminoris]|uniref:Capsule polysaccharide biosynthesis protein n=1 Tax=Palleronia marisminoris TaxID=315423 RepID=A0A1Y5RF09_9RHOB|nr:capsular biosynthesis protein [Palleronia marisminoris]SLN15582.1 Capsule polysaccharide biosynthesis protein [Palleronia marisminoris]